ncbi:MAG: substrate-binding domain-containing protein [Opitutaceae bacterium]|jgi:LacI family transcriptional regulator
MEKISRVALVFRGETLLANKAFFLGAHQFAHTRPDWKIVYLNGTTRLSWEEALSVRPDGILGVIPHGTKLTRRETGDSHVVILNNEKHPFHKVVSDGAAAVQKGADHLLKRHLVHFAFVGQSGWFFSDQRQHAFKEALKAAGQPYPLAVADFGDLQLDPDRFHRWLKSLPVPCGILCPNDVVGMKVIMACRDAGLDVPRDMAVLGIGNYKEVCAESPVTLSSVEPHFETVGYRAAAFLYDLLRGKSVSNKPVLVPPGEVIVRESTKVFALKDPLVGRAMTIIHEEHIEPLTVPDLLSRLGNLSQRLLELRFKECLGSSPYHEILNARIQRAQRLLRSTALSLEEIAYRSGFYDASQFSRHFKKLCGQTPSRYRSTHNAPSSADRHDPRT